MKDKHLWILVPPFCGSAFLFIYFWHEPWSRMRWIGAGMIVAGFAFWTVAHVQLGASFSASAQARNLLRTGFIRGFGIRFMCLGRLASPGVFLFLHMLVLLLVFLALIPMQIFRARNEARVLENAFGDEYREYRKKTWF